MTDTIKEKRLQFSGQCRRRKGGGGRPPRIYIHQHTYINIHQCDDTGLGKEGLEKAMEDKDGWKKVVRSFRSRTLL